MRLIESGDEVIVTYESRKTDGSRFRNTEILTFTGQQISVSRCTSGGRSHSTGVATTGTVLLSGRRAKRESEQGGCHWCRLERALTTMIPGPRLS